jgi:amphi-Trp domain-containing protein
MAESPNQHTGEVATDGFFYSSLQDTDSIVRYLEAVCDGLRKGELRLRSGDNDLVVEPGGLIKFKVKVDRKSDRVKLSIKLGWREQKREQVSDAGALFIEIPEDGEEEDAS